MVMETRRKTLTDELKLRAKKALKDGVDIDGVVERFGIGRATAFALQWEVQRGR